MINSIDDTLRVTLRDNGFAFLSYKYGDRIRPVRIDFNKYANRQTCKGSVSTTDVQRIVSNMLFSSSKIVSLKYSSLNFSFNFGLKKFLPVKIAGKVSSANNYYMSHAVFVPERVAVYGSRQVLDSLRYVSTTSLNISNFRDTVVRKVRLQPIKGAKIVPDEVTLTIYPDVLTEESVEVPVVAVNMPENKVLRLFPSRVKVMFSIGASRYHGINANEFRVVADYNDIVSGSSEKCSLKLTRVPSEVANAHLDISQVDYLIEQQ